MDTTFGDGGGLGGIDIRVSIDFGQDTDNKACVRPHARGGTTKGDPD